MQELWFIDAMQANRLWWVPHVSYPIFDNDLLSAFVERWYEESSSFHLMIKEMMTTLGDVSCLLHILIDGFLLNHDIFLTRYEVVDLMVELLGSDLGRLSTRGEKQVFMHVSVG